MKRRLPARALAAACLLAFGLSPAPAAAFDFSRVWERLGLTSASAPAREGPVLRYEATLTVADGAHLEPLLRRSSHLIARMNDPPPDLVGLIALARADRPQLVAVLYSEAHYGAVVEIAVADRPLETVELDARLSEPVPVEIRVRPGPVFVFGAVRILEPDAPAGAERAQYGLVPGEPARSALVVAAEAQLVERWRAQGHPLARISTREVVADHATGRLDVTLGVAPGPVAAIGDIRIEGLESLDPRFVAEQTGLRPGARYHPEDLREAERRLRRLEVFASVRVSEATALAPDGTIPILVQVSELEPRVIGVGTTWSSADGAAVEAYWAHHNLFGRAERFRIEGHVGDIGSGASGRLTYGTRAVFVRPGTFTPDTDLMLEAVGRRERPDAYDSTIASGQAGLSHRIGPNLTGSTGVAVAWSDVEDAFGEQDYLLVGLPNEVVYDSRDHMLDATRGMRAAAAVEPVYDTIGDHGMLFARKRVTAYHALDAERRFVLAGKVAAGATAVDKPEFVPADRRHFVGGGGSIRGYAYKNVGPRRDGELVGGLSFVETSAELRIRLTETLGLVPFVDAGAAYENQVPDFSQPLKVGAGVGVRYLTPIGPLRLDVAVPLDPGPGDPSWAIYAGVGQAY